MIDILILITILMFGIVGFKKGFIKEACSIVGIIIVLILSFIFKNTIGDFLCKYIPFISLSNNYKNLVSLNILLYETIGFLIIFSFLYLIYSIILKICGIVDKLVKATIILIIPSKLLGLLVGLIKGYIFCFILLIILNIALYNNKLFESNLKDIIIYKTPILSSLSIPKTINKTYDLSNKVINKEISYDKANVLIIDYMVEYNVIDKKLVKQLIVLDKLKVKGLEKYE